MEILNRGKNGNKHLMEEKDLAENLRKTSGVPDVFTGENFRRELSIYMRLISYPVGIGLSQVLIAIQPSKVSKN